MVSVQVVIPAYNEQETVGDIVSRVFRFAGSLQSRECSITKVIVVDNNSTDATAIEAEKAGAVVVHERRRGYGAACLRGLKETDDADIVIFLDADGSDLPVEWPSLVVPILEDRADLVVGSRIIGKAEGLPAYQRITNLLATFLLNLRYGCSLTDIGPYRAIRRNMLDTLMLGDHTFGLALEMEIKALRAGLKLAEVGVSSRLRQGGRSDVFRKLVRSVRITVRNFLLIFRDYFSAPERVSPVPVKTRY